MSVSHSELHLDAGQVILADPHLNFYQVRPLFTLEAAPEILTATVLGSTAGVSGGVFDRPTYQIGSTVLFARRRDYSKQQSVAQAIILGAISIDASSNPRNMQTLVYGALGTWNTRVYDLMRTALQRSLLIRDYSSNGPADVRAGERVIQGKNTSFVVGDDRFAVRSGQVSVYGSAVDRRLATTSLLRTEHTIGSEEDIKILGTSLLYVNRSTGNPADAYGKCYKEEHGVIVPIEDSRPKFRKHSQSGDIIQGYDEALYDKDYNTVLGKERVDYEGRYVRQSVSGFAFERTPFIPFFRYDGPRFGKHALPAPPITDPYKGLEDAEGWVDGGYDGVWERTLKAMDEGDGEFEVDWIELGSDDQKLAVATGKAGIYGTADGGVLIRDSFGSEIIMTGGNIQVSAANNITNTAGRDILNILPGVYTISAEAGINIGSTGVLSIYGKERLVLDSEDLYLKSAKNISVRAAGALTMKGLVASLTSMDRAGSVTVGVDSSKLLFSAESTILHSSNALQLSTRTATVAVGGGSIVLAASQVQSTGALILQKTNISIPVPEEGGEGFTTATIHGANPPSLWLEGTAIITGSVRINSDLIVRQNAVVKNAIYQQQSEDKKMSSSRAMKPDKMPGGPASTLSSMLARGVSRVAKLLMTLAEALNKPTPKTFDLESAAFTIRETMWSATATGATAVKPVVSVESSGETSYIYPGKGFWTSTGMLRYTDTPITPDLEYTEAGAAGFRVGVTNAKRSA